MTNFSAFDLSFTQVQMQDYLEKIYQAQGLSAVLEKLFEWEMGVGYLTEGKLKDNLRFAYPDPETGVIFKTQINIARSNYSPKPLDGKNVPKLHCPICFDNIGIPGKEDLRAFSFELEPNRKFFIQLTPFPLFTHHCVLVDHLPRPMIMSKQSVLDLVNFLNLAPGYVGCSNSDVEWAGASILSHHHYQVFKNLKLPVMEARWAEGLFKRTNVWGYTVEYGFLNYPIAVMKLTCRDQDVFIESAGALIQAWKSQVPGQNTLNLIVQKLEKNWVAYLILRNPDHRTPAELTHIKSEGVGIIEVAGEGIYPVPKGEQAEKIMTQIKEKGLDVIKGIIAGNNPLEKSQWPQQLDLFSRALMGLAKFE